MENTLNSSHAIIRKRVNRWLPKFAWVITSRISTAMQNFTTIRLRHFGPIYAKLPIGYFFGSWQLGTPKVIGRFWRCQKTSFRTRMCLLGEGRVPKLLLHFDPIFPQNANFRSIFDGTENFGSKRALTWGTSSVNIPKSKTTSYAFGSWIN